MKVFKLFSLLVVFAMVLSSCKEDESRSIESISFHQKVFEVKVGETVRLGYRVEPSGLSPSIVMESSNSRIVSVVGENGSVRGVSRGNAIVSITGIYGGAVASDACEVRVVDQEATSITLAEHDKELYVGDECVLSYSIVPDNATSKSVVWSTTDDGVVTVTDGRVKAVGAGEANVIVALVGSQLADTCKIKVSAVAVKSITLSEQESKSYVGETFTLDYVILPENATNKTVVWHSDNERVATIDSGVVSAVGAGTANIVVTVLGTTIKDSCKVEVSNVDVADIRLSESSVTIEKGRRCTVVAEVLPANATVKTIEWSSSNISVATVNDGVIVGQNIGSCVVYAKSHDGKVVRECAVKVTPVKVANVQIEMASRNLMVGDKVKVGYVISPSDAADQRVEITSDNESVAAIENGWVIAKSTGEAQITVRTLDGNHSSSARIVVRDLPQMMKLDCSGYTQSIGGYMTAVCFFTITNNSNHDVTVTKFEIIESGTNRVVYRIEDEYPLGLLMKGSGMTVGQIQFRDVYKPRVVWYFTYDGKEYEAEGLIEDMSGF